MTNVHLREYAGPDAMDVLTLQWRELYAQDAAATPFQSPGWLTAWARQLPHTAVPVVLAATNASGRILAALALARHTGAGRDRLVPLSAPHAESVRLIGPRADDPAVAQPLAFYLLLADGTADVALTDVIATSALGSCLSAMCESSTWSASTTACAAVPLPVRYESLPTSTRRQHVRRRRVWARLASEQEVTYTRTRHTDDLLDAFDVLCELHAKRWEGHDPHPDGLRAEEIDQWRAVLRDLGNEAFIASVAVKGQVIAAQLLLTRGTRCYSLIPAMDPAQLHLAPGHALLRHLAQSLAEEGIRILDLGRTTGSARSYKGQYAPEWTCTVSAISAPHRAAA
ncbi:GNAT family N-acetyltransferase [Streptomyces sp. NPDC001089]